MKFLRTFAAVLGLFLLLIAHASPNAMSAEYTAEKGDVEFDRLDGVGASGKKVQVIEWKANLEIHVYPKNSLVGLGLKLLKNDKGSYVFVEAYRFDNAPRVQLIRRNVLSDKWVEGYKAYRAPSDADYDKIVIIPAGSPSPSDMTVFKLDDSPTQLFPSGSPELAKPAKPANPLEGLAAIAGRNGVPIGGSSVGSASGGSASAGAGSGANRSDDSTSPSLSGSASKPSGHVSADDSGVDDAGSLRPFFSDPQPRHK